VRGKRGIAGDASGRLERIDLGRAGESAVASLLESEGWLIVARNFRAGRGEIDLVAAKDGLLAFIEVKNWRVFGPEELAEVVGTRKRRRIVETSQIFLSRHREYSNVRIRYDLILLKEERVERRIESAFTGDL
jgi:putative endonuclease